MESICIFIRTLLDYSLSTIMQELKGNLRSKMDDQAIIISGTMNRANANQAHFVVARGVRLSRKRVVRRDSFDESRTISS